jgi:hypothetical protein
MLVKSNEELGEEVHLIVLMNWWLAEEVVRLVEGGGRQVEKVERQVEVEKLVEEVERQMEEE